jgi:hypothetical protein
MSFSRHGCRVESCWLRVGLGKDCKMGPPSKCATYVVVHQAVGALPDDMQVAVVPEAQVETANKIVIGWKCGPNSLPQLASTRINKAVIFSRERKARMPKIC